MSLVNINDDDNSSFHSYRSFYSLRSLLPLRIMADLNAFFDPEEIPLGFSVSQSRLDLSEDLGPHRYSLFPHRNGIPVPSTQSFTSLPYSTSSDSPYSHFVAPLRASTPSFGFAINRPIFPTIPYPFPPLLNDYPIFPSPFGMGDSAPFSDPHPYQNSARAPPPLCTGYPLSASFPLNRAEPSVSSLYHPAIPLSPPTESYEPSISSLYHPAIPLSPPSESYEPSESPHPSLPPRIESTMGRCDSRRSRCRFHIVDSSSSSRSHRACASDSVARDASRVDEDDPLPSPPHPPVFFRLLALFRLCFGGENNQI